MNKATLGMTACTLAAFIGVYVWYSRAEPDAATPEPHAAEAPGARTELPVEPPDSPDPGAPSPASLLPGVADVPDPAEIPVPASPEQRAVAIARLASAMQPVYEDVGQEVGLDGPETEALIRLMAEHQLRLSDANLDYSAAGAAALDELKTQFQREIELQIGTDRARRLSAYQDSVNARYEVEEARRVLETASQPLTEAQKKAWIREAIERGAFVDEPDFPGGASNVAMMQELLARIELRDQKLLGVARGILDPQQFQSYESFISERRERFDADIRRQEQEAVSR